MPKSLLIKSLIRARHAEPVVCKDTSHHEVINQLSCFDEVDGCESDERAQVRAVLALWPAEARACPSRYLRSQAQDSDERTTMQVGLYELYEKSGLYPMCFL